MNQVQQPLGLLHGRLINASDSCYMFENCTDSHFGYVLQYNGLLQQTILYKILSVSMFGKHMVMNFFWPKVQNSSKVDQS